MNNIYLSPEYSKLRNENDVLLNVKKAGKKICLISNVDIIDAMY